MFSFTENANVQAWAKMFRDVTRFLFCLIRLCDDGSSRSVSSNTFVRTDCHQSVDEVGQFVDGVSSVGELQEAVAAHDAVGQSGVTVLTFVDIELRLSALETVWLPERQVCRARSLSSIVVDSIRFASHVIATRMWNSVLIAAFRCSVRWRVAQFAPLDNASPHIELE